MVRRGRKSAWDTEKGQRMLRLLIEGKVRQTEVARELGISDAAVCMKKKQVFESLGINRKVKVVVPPGVRIGGRLDPSVSRLSDEEAALESGGGIVEGPSRDPATGEIVAEGGEKINPLKIIHRKVVEILVYQERTVGIEDSAYLKTHEVLQRYLKILLDYDEFSESDFEELLNQVDQLSSFVHYAESQGFSGLRDLYIEFLESLSETDSDSGTRSKSSKRSVKTSKTKNNDKTKSKSKTEGGKKKTSGKK